MTDDDLEGAYAQGYDDGAAMVQQSMDEVLDNVRLILSTHRERMRRARGNLCAIRARTIAEVERAVRF